MGTNLFIQRRKPMAKIVMICGHPDYDHSVANKAIVDEFAKLVPSAEIAILAQLYPDFRIDAKKEQDRLVPAEMIIFEYPFWWYSAPSLMHRYLELVFLHGWAYGSQGQALKGKNLALSFTVGGPESEYQRRSGVMHTIEQFLPEMLATAHFTGMTYRGAIHSFNMACYDPADKDRIEADARNQAKRLKDHIAQFVSI